MFEPWGNDVLAARRLRAAEPDQLEDAQDLSVVQIEVIEDRVCTLAGHLAAATCRWLLLLGEYDARNGWHGPGLLSCAHWLSWRCGLSITAARQHVRVARALRRLPRVREVFAEGRLSYSKVRSITRVATPEIEDRLVDLALSCTAAQLDVIVGKYRRTKALETRPDGRSGRSTTWHWDHDGSLLVRSRLSPEEGALYLAAIEAMQHQLDAEAKSGDPAGSPPGDPEHGLCGDETAIAFQCSTTDAVVAMAHAALAAGPIDTSGSDRFEVVLHADLDQLTGPPAEQPVEQETEPPESDRAHGHVSRPLGRRRCHLRDGPCVHPATLHRLACDAAIRVMVHGPDGSPKDTGRRTRLVKRGTRRLLEERDGRRCQYPGCRHTKFLHAHHVVHWAHGGRTDLDNLILLCSFHHRLLHEHGYTVQIRGPGSFEFFRPDGTLIDQSPPLGGEPWLHRLPSDVHVAPPITEKTTTPSWAGERVNLGYVVSLLLPPDPDIESEVG